MIQKFGDQAKVLKVFSALCFCFFVCVIWLFVLLVTVMFVCLFNVNYYYNLPIKYSAESQESATSLRQRTETDNRYTFFNLIILI